MEDEQPIEEPTTRGSFVKRLAKMVAVGVGISLVPATSASATLFKCCRDTSCDQWEICGHWFLYGYRCDNNPCGGCCSCWSRPDLGCITISNTCPC
jgi:hypothetical protein